MVSASFSSWKCKDHPSAKQVFWMTHCCPTQLEMRRYPKTQSMCTSWLGSNSCAPLRASLPLCSWVCSWAEPGCVQSSWCGLETGGRNDICSQLMVRTFWKGMKEATRSVSVLQEFWLVHGLGECCLCPNFGFCCRAMGGGELLTWLCSVSDSGVQATLVWQNSELLCCL